MSIRKGEWVLLAVFFLMMVWMANNAMADYQKMDKGWKYYRVQRGDNLTEIAEKFNVSVEDIVARNTDVIENKHLIHPGQKLKILQKKTRWIAESSRSGGLKDKKDYYKVHKGDTLFKISKRFRVPVKQIMALNPRIKDKDLIYAGQKIRLGRDLDLLSSREFGPREKRILKRVGVKTGVDWKILYGLCKKESDLGRVMVGDNGQSLGWFQIHTGYHPDVAASQAMDLEWAAEWAAGYLIKMGYFQDKFRALQRYNGSVDNPVTARRANQVIAYAEDAV
jgi:LysM repeat protein